MALYNGNSRIAISSGDPAGIGPEVILKSFLLLPKGLKRQITVFGDPDHFRWLNLRLGTNVPIVDAKEAKVTDDDLKVEMVAKLKFSDKDFGRVNKKFGEAAMRSFDCAAKAVMEGRFGALVTAPIQKESVRLAGYNIAGHTEYLAGLTRSNVAMMLSCKKLSVVLVTTHVSIKDVASKIKKSDIEEKIKIIDTFFTKMRGKRPIIAVCGLNPHASDGGLFGNEEAKIIGPAIEKLQKSGVNVKGPYPADTLFTPGFIKTFDVALAMYHDQGLVPVKLLGFGKTVNITLGLPFLRVSVDHGTAFDIAGQNRADPSSMVHTIKKTAAILKGHF